MFFSGAAVSLACTPIQLMNATCAIAAAAPLKNKRNGVGCLATIDMALLTELGRQHSADVAGAFRAIGHTSGRALGGLNNHEKDVVNDLG